MNCEICEQEFEKPNTCQCQMEMTLEKQVLQALEYYFSFYADVQQTAPEYFENCYDRNAVEYLRDEAETIYNRFKSKVHGEKAMEAANQ